MEYELVQEIYGERIAANPHQIRAADGLIGNNRRKYCCLSVGKSAVDGPIEELWYISVIFKALISTLPINGKSFCLSDRVLHCNHFRYNAVSKD